MRIEGLIRLTCTGLHKTCQCWIHRYRVPIGTEYQLHLKVYYKSMVGYYKDYK